MSLKSERSLNSKTPLGTIVRRLALIAGLLGTLFAAVPARAATIVVNSTADPGGFNAAITIATLGSTVTLRDAVNAAINAGGNQTITFDPSLAGQTIVLSQSQTVSGAGTPAFGITVPGIVIQGLTNGPGISISGGGALQMFFVRDNGTLALNDLTL